MSYPRIDPADIAVRPLAERRSFITLDQADADARSRSDAAPDAALSGRLDRLANRIRAARDAGASVMLTYGAHLIKNGGGPLVADLIRGGWLTHLATQGAGIIHDWEFAHLGRTSESVRDNAADGSFGAWKETGQTLIAAMCYGADHDMGLGEAVGDVINRHPDRHPHRDRSLTAVAQAHDVPLCVLPGVGYDIYVCHPDFTEDAGAALGRCATRDFHTFCHGVSNLAGGVYLSIGSAIMSPQVFEKAFSIANNLRGSAGQPMLSDFHIAVVDLQPGGDWNWTAGEPPQTHPAYYLRFCKSFHRLAQGRQGEPDPGALDYLQADNRLILRELTTRL